MGVEFYLLIVNVDLFEFYTFVRSPTHEVTRHSTLPTFVAKSNYGAIHLLRKYTDISFARIAKGERDGMHEAMAPVNAIHTLLDRHSYHFSHANSCA